MGIASVIILVLAGIIYRSLNPQSNRNSRNKAIQPVKCPICQSNLFVGENIISKVYRPMNVPDQLMTISGCPHCYPTCEPGKKRECPVCHKNMTADQTLTARLFNKQLGKKHVHVVGCSNCHKPVAK